ncbi:MAG: hypothetical protein HKO96_12095 [Flavobacteriaceae bacterium]|nr:hypothetical protein [Flavobacteriaceae bacterium]NNK71212.1 hypothetical protein [Flavobacteriaceae bacterium]NNL79809.1 hypothetical protein [Flavobacteriaceae bacterium]
MRSFTTETDWGSGLNFPWYLDAGYTIDEDFEDAMNDDNNFKDIGATGARYVTIDGVNKLISLD